MLSVHTVVSFDFAVSVIPGWHATIFPPYFVAGAIYSGFAMVLTLAIPVRRFYGMESLITMRHIDNMAKVMLATGLIVGYGYAMEAFFAWYSASPHEKFMMWNRMFGPYAWSYWTLISINVVMVQFLWLKRVRHNIGLLFVMSLLVNVGMWLERFVIVVTSLASDFVPSSWGITRRRSGTSCCFSARSACSSRVPAVPALRADDFDLRSQDAAAAGQGESGALKNARRRRAQRRRDLSHIHETSNALHGVMAEYDTGQALVDAARKTMAQGFTRVEAYSPVPIEDLNTIIHKSRTVLPALVLAGGLAGMATGFALQYWASVIEYP